MHMPRLFKREKGSIGMHWYKGKPFIWNVVQFMINFNLFTNHGRFKVGDKVRYNWKAYVLIKSALWRKEDHETLTVSEIVRNGSGVAFKEGSGCDAFWIRKAFFWEY
jgi:hypothetical protein